MTRQSQNQKKKRENLKDQNYKEKIDKRTEIKQSNTWRRKPQVIKIDQIQDNNSSVITRKQEEFKPNHKNIVIQI